MSGHSKWSTIKRQKEATDAKRGQLFSKLARAITLAAKAGGTDLSGNLRLKIAIEQARASNMPKENITRAIERGSGAEAGSLEEVIYEGYGPGGVAVIVEAATDNRNRTAQEIKNIFERAGGSLAGPGSVSFQFEQKGLILVEKGSNPEKTELALIDLGVPDLDETEDGIEVYIPPAELAQWREKIVQGEFKIKSAELVYKPRSLVEIQDKERAQKVFQFMEALDGHDDVQKVFANPKVSFQDFDMPQT